MMGTNKEINGYNRSYSMKQIITVIGITILIIATLLAFDNLRQYEIEEIRGEVVHAQAEETLPEPITAPVVVVVPEVVPEPPHPVEVAVEPAVEQTINQAQAGVTYSPNDCEQYRPILARYDWDITIAMAVMKAESGCRKDAFNPEAHRGCDGSYSVMQVACVNYISYNMQPSFDPDENIELAYRLYASSGWRIWGAYTNQSYTRYLQ